MATKKKDDLALLFLDSDPRKPKLRRDIAKEIKSRKAVTKPENDFRLLCGIISRHATGLWSVVAAVEFVIIIWVKLGK